MFFKMVGEYGSRFIVVFLDLLYTLFLEANGIDDIYFFLFPGPNVIKLYTYIPYDNLQMHFFLTHYQTTNFRLF